MADKCWNSYLTSCLRPVYVNGWSVCFLYSVGKMNLENAEFFLDFLALVGPLPAGYGNFLIFVTCIN